MGQRLSILICNTQTRVNNFLPKIVEELCRQAEGHDVEVIWLGDNKKRTVGEKRNDLLRISKGDYICFVDDDDRVSPTYVDDILRATKKNPDLITFYAERRHNGKKDRLVVYDINYMKDENMQGRYQRLPNHLMVWRGALARRVSFINSNYGEDGDWARRMKGYHSRIKQVQINKVLYYYDFNSQTTETQIF